MPSSVLAIVGGALSGPALKPVRELGHVAVTVGHAPPVVRTDIAALEQGPKALNRVGRHAVRPRVLAEAGARRWHGGSRCSPV